MRVFLNGAGRMFLLGLLTGCGSSLTGGSVPLGTVSGTVSRAINPNQTVANIPLTLVTSDGQDFHTVSQADGTFVFIDVPSGAAQLEVPSQPQQGLQGLHLSLNIGVGQATDVAAALIPEDLVVEVTAITLTPSQVTLEVGQQQRFQATLTGSHPARLNPTWIVDGGIGRLSPGGMFRAEHPGTGQIRALVGDIEGSATVVVTAGNGGPPGPGGRVLGTTRKGRSSPF